MKEFSPRKQAIYNAAALLFKEEGYTASSMRDISRKVGLEVSSLYSHIRSKEEILVDICFDCADRFLNGQKKILSSELSSNEKLKEMLTWHVQVATDDLSSVTVFNDEWRHMSEEPLKKFVKHRREYENGFMRVLIQGKEEGLFREELDPRIVLNTLLNSVRWLQSWYRPDRKMKRAEIAEQVINIVMYGLFKS
jgi:AcrR family transcriptional regulator